jgi:hypothetical protein
VSIVQKVNSQKLLLVWCLLYKVSYVSIKARKRKALALKYLRILNILGVKSNLECIRNLCPNYSRENF